MDALERLTADELARQDLLAAHHLHRYHLAAALCSGLRVIDLGCGIGYGARILADGGAAAVQGVDRDERVVEEAARRYGDDAVSFAAGDAVDALRRVDPEAVDAIVAFEVLEHLDRFGEAMDLLQELAARGMRLALSVPNSRTFGERNAFHATDFDYDSATAAFERFDGVRLLFQHIAEGSVVLGAGDRVEGRLDALHYGEPEYANSFIALVGFDEAGVAAALAHLNLVVTPNHNRYMLSLQAGNRELHRVNNRLARSWLGKSDGAAASVLGRHAEAERELRAVDAHLRARISELEAELRRRVDELTAEVLQVGDERAELQRRVDALERKRAVRAALYLDSLRPSQRR
jgi:SAM-dependent methyltransferase